MDLKSILALNTAIKDDKFNVFCTKFGNVKASYAKNQFPFCKDFFLNKKVGHRIKMYVKW